MQYAIGLYPEVLRTYVEVMCRACGPNADSVSVENSLRGAKVQR